ncbi:MAG: hypothetical protein K2Q06_15815, partial [Parvularculaceae bacterium]|nr:hypothetical protein [Parvularculaceae bacterium]
PDPAVLSRAQREAIRRFDADVRKSLKDLLGDMRERRNFPPKPLPSAAELEPERGLAAAAKWFRPKAEEVKAAKPKPRTIAAVEAERIAPLSTISPRDAVILHADVFSDVWALGIAWDYAAYLLMLAYLLFPSAERAAGWKDRRD